MFNVTSAVDGAKSGATYNMNLGHTVRRSLTHPLHTVLSSLSGDIKTSREERLHLTMPTTIRLLLTYIYAVASIACYLLSHITDSEVNDSKTIKVYTLCWCIYFLSLCNGSISFHV